MFCTECETSNPSASVTCRNCGASFTAARSAQRRQAPHERILRVLYLTPLLIIVVSGTVMLDRRVKTDTAAAESYRTGTIALATGRYDRALDAFAAAGSYADAEAQRAHAERLLTPYRDGYQQGLAALERGEFTAAIAALLPVARDLPDYQGATTRLAEARRGQAAQLHREYEGAVARHDWLAAEQSLTALAGVEPGN